MFNVIDNKYLERKIKYEFKDLSDRTLVVENISPKTRLGEVNKLFEKIYKQPDSIYYEKDEQLKT